MTIPADAPTPGRVVILNGVPRAGKSSIARALQLSSARDWLCLGVDAQGETLPPRLRPGVGLRPGGERPDLEPAVARLYAALFASIAAHSRLGFDVVADLGLHERHSRPLGIAADAIRRLAGLPVLFVGVRCPLAVILERRRAAEPGREGLYLAPAAGEPVPAPVLAWEEAVHGGRRYDLEVDTSRLAPEDCARAIEAALAATPPLAGAFARLASGAGGPPSDGAEGLVVADRS